MITSPHEIGLTSDEAWLMFDEVCHWLTLNEAIENGEIIREPIPKLQIFWDVAKKYETSPAVIETNFVAMLNGNY